MTHPPSNQPVPGQAERSRDATPLVIGTRGSALALHQAEFAANALRTVSGGREVHVQIVTSEGDIDKTSPLTTIGGRGVFTSSLQRSLIARQVDAAVHSSKDVPSLAASGLALAAFPQREDPRDVVVSRHGVGLSDLPPNPVVGTSSRRRAIQVRALRPDARIVDLRGNIDTRLTKAGSESYDAIILAAAGLTRMGWLDRAAAMLPVDQFTPAPGQGALAIETRESPDDAFALVHQIDNPGIRLALEVERAFLRGIGGGCSTPLGAHATVETRHGLARIRFHGMLARDDGTGLTRVYEEWLEDDAVDRAFRLAQDMVRDVRPNRVLGGSTDLERQLRGMNVVVTGSDHLVERAGEEVRRRGGSPVHMPTIRIEAPLDPRPLHEAIDRLQHGRYDRIVLTSRNAVDALAEHFGNLVPGSSPHITVIGESTARALRATGHEPRLVAHESSGEGVVRALAKEVVLGERILLPVSDRARSVIADGLIRLGADVTVVTAYETHVLSEIDRDLELRMARGEIGAVLLASPSAVEGFVAQAGHVLPAMSGACFVAIGSVTANAMKVARLPVHAVPSKPGVIAMVQALAEYLWGDTAEHADEGSQ